MNLSISRNLRTPLKWIGMLAVVYLLAELVLFNIFILPGINESVHDTFLRAEMQHNIRLSQSLKNSLLRLFTPYTLNIVDLVEKAKNRELIKDDIETLNSLPDVKDAFYINYKTGINISLNKFVSSKLLYDKLELIRGNQDPKITLDSTLTVYKVKYLSLDVESPNLILIYRHVWVNKIIESVVGVIYDFEPLLNYIPTYLDSLVAEDYTLRNFKPSSHKSHWYFGGISDGIWSQTLGLTHQNDTIWWIGDRGVVIKDFSLLTVMDHYSGSVREFNGLGLKLYVQTKYPVSQDLLYQAMKSSENYIRLVQLVSILLIITFLILFNLTRKQAKRNQIALSYLAHSIKTPVSRIRLDTDSLLEYMVTSPDDEREIIRATSHESSRMELAVQSAALSLQSGKRVYTIESCDLSEIVNGTSEAWRSNFDHAKVKLIINKNNEQIKGKFDAEMIAVMIDNLLDNALRHTILNINNLKDKTATVTVGMQLSGGMADMVISDMGGGIPVKERKLVFSQFRKLKADAGTGATGLGLGLALVKEIAEAHGGSVTIADNEIGGSIISINLKMEN